MGKMRFTHRICLKLRLKDWEEKPYNERFYHNRGESIIKETEMGINSMQEQLQIIVTKYNPVEHCRNV